MATRIFFAMLVILGGVLIQRYINDPYRTPLPFGSTDLSGVQDKLARLRGDERALVEAYVKRSRGDVLPARFADPDAPLTARTFGEAIRLQRDWQAKMKVADARTAALRARREASLAPLRELVDASVVKAEIITRNEYQARKDPGFYQRPYRVDHSPAFVIRIRVRNLGDETILAMRGSLQAHDNEEQLTVDLCWIDLRSNQTLAPGASLDIDCGHDYRTASEQQMAFVRKPEGRFRVEWEPSYLKLASGRELSSGL